MIRQEEAVVVNLRQVRKRKARADSEAEAAQNRILHGRTREEKARDRLETERSASRLENHRLEPKRSPGDGA